MQSVNTILETVTRQYGGKIKKYNKNITCTRGRGAFLRGWSTQQPGYHDRTIMMQDCGKKCFLGPRKTFPICTRNTCKINRKGVYSALIRAREYSTIRGSQKYYRIATNARRLLRKTNRKC
jgi:hypothetical protein